MKKTLTKLLLYSGVVLFGLSGAQNVYAQQADGTEVYLQGFHWESADPAKKDWWLNLQTKVPAIKSASIDGVWLPPSSDAGDRAGYLPRKWYDLESDYGTEQELRDLISSLNQDGVISIADIVINHRVGCTSWADFCEPALGCQAITSDDEVNQQFPGDGCGDFDTGTPYSAARDINHRDSETRQAIKDWMNWLKNDVGYSGWRYDFVHGFGAEFFAEYNNATSPYISIGENWTSDTQAIVNWMDGTQQTSTAFDFPLKFALHEAVNGNYGALNNGGKMPGVAGVWPQNSVTFLENHDTEPVRQGDHPGTSFPNDPSTNSQVLQGYAYILTHAGSPMVFYSHLFDYGLYDDISKMVAIRKANGIHNNSTVNIQQSDGNGYAAIIDNSVAVRLGNTSWSPSGSGWILQSDGLNYSIWSKQDIDQEPIVSISPDVMQSFDPITVTISSDDDRDGALPIYYTLDGTEPTTSSSVYSDNNPIVLTATTTVIAKSFDSSGNSGRDERTYYVGEELPEMKVYVHKPAGWGTLYAHHWSAIPSGVVEDSEWPGKVMTKVEGTEGWYMISLAGTESSNFVFHDFNGNQDEDILISGSSWYREGVVTNECTIDCPDEDTTVVMVSITPASTTFENEMTVSLNGTTGSNIYYTTDGSTPSNGSNVYSNPFPITETTTISAIAYLNGSSSEVKSETYTLFVDEDTTVIIPDKPAKKSDFTWDNATVYFTMTDRFYDGDPSNNNAYGRGTNGNGQPYTDDSSAGEFHGGDLKGMTAKLREGYFESIGVNAIWITSPVEQMHGWVGGSSDGSFRHYGYHGYYAMDWTEIDQNMGTENDFVEFIDEAHSRGIRVVVDVVMNHTGYVTMHDMEQYNYGSLDPAWKTWQPAGGESWHSYHEKFIDYNSGGTWLSNYWGPEWMRHPDIDGYDGCSSGGGIDNCVGFLPDLKTEDVAPVGIPAILVNKWTQEGTYDQKKAELDAFFSQTGLPRVVSNYMIFWLTDWVRKYGIDGFRVDTAKHVELDRWARLKQYAIQALKDWKEENPDKAMDDEEFWMTAEVWGHGKNKSEYHSVGQFNSVINFGLKNDARVASRDASSLESLFSEYATINDDPTWNSLSYLSSHDVVPLFDRNSLQAAGPGFLLLPGGIQIFYGDESGRPEGGWSDAEQNTRSDMNWGNFNQAQHDVWKKLGTFRRDHPSVGAGSHQKIGDAPYTFVREYNNDDKEIYDKVIVAIGANGQVSFDVNGHFADGDTIIDRYTGAMDIIENGSVSFTADSEGIILLEDINYQPIISPKISMTAGVYDPNSVAVTITVTDKEDPNPVVYLTKDANETKDNYLNWTKLSAQDTSFTVTTTTTVKVVAINANGIMSTGEEKYQVGAIDPINIWVYRPSTWGSPYIHLFDATPTGITEDTVWPGQEMNLVSGEWYHVAVEALSVGVVANNNGGEQLEDYTVTKDSWYKDGQWYSQCPGECPGEQGPTVSINPSTGNYPIGDLNVTMTATFDGVIYYTTDGTAADTTSTPYSGGFVVSGQDGDIVTVRAIAKNEAGVSDEVTATYTFKDEATFVFYAKGYSHAYYWEVQENGVITIENPVSWPGVAMEDASEIGSGWKKITVTGGTCSNVIFSNGGGGQTGDLTTCGNEGMGYENGQWIEIGPDTVKPTLGLTPAAEFQGSGTVTITATDNKTASPKIYYTTDGSTPTESSLSGSGAVNIELNTPGTYTVKAFAKDEAGNVSDVAMETYTVVEVTAGFRVYFQGVSNPLIHYWGASPAGSYPSTSWPGVSLMEANGEDAGWYYYEFPSSVNSINLLFHNNAGYKSPDLTRDKEGWYKNGVWYDAKPPQPTGLTVHFKSPWGNSTRIHYWNASNGSASAWPGELMENEGNAWYSYTIEGASSSNLLFHNGSGEQTSDMSRDREGWYKDGVWYDSNPESSGTRLINLEERIDLSVYPTMVQHKFTVQLTADNQMRAQFSLYDLNGRLQYSEQRELLYGNQKIEMNAQNLSTGMYILKVQIDDEVMIRKIYKN
ncbi:starch-binding protein [Flammeovirga yaeyamensis]|uniref:Starch-binding protein n=1 Tax=Flammeovirga yaeyamensis TaxID=367791 RepID=A0AAX1N5N9_9BACT|nr:starch-binding protein [Flammeovirga yaeyamensis]MBB3697361.1 glycosidase [Flammeovirga yaeyamensis]NMF36055.1 starch-binding protein [Flammeovirga yaeyamensis]QWG02790.1 starch-binding protein [Flammeovirga yaeyamensis]